MKKILGLAIAFIIVASSFTSCVRNLEVNVDSDLVGAVSDLANNYINQESSLSSDKATENVAGNQTEKATDGSNEASTDESTENSTENTDDNNNDNNDNNNNNDNQNQGSAAVTPTVNINGTVSNWTLGEGICSTFTTAQTLSNTKFEVNIPVSEAGEYELNFDTYLGLTRTFSSGSKKASLSLPKTVFKEGEPIPVAYSTSGISTANSNSPWMAITKNVGGVDKYICYEYIKKNTSGVIDASVMTGGREDNSVQNYVWLPAGEYRIYFIDESYAHTRNKAYWLHDEPINISIIPENSVGTTVTRSGSTYGSASLSVANNIFCYGTDIAIKYTASNLSGASSSTRPWIALAKTVVESTGIFDYYTHWSYTDTTASSIVSFTKTNGSAQTQVLDYKTLPIGSYRIYYVSGANLQSGIEYTDEPIGINIAPAATLNAKLGSSSLLSTNSPYDISNVNKPITVTESDVALGYITVSFSFDSLTPSTTYFLSVQNVSLVK